MSLLNWLQIVSIILTVAIIPTLVFAAKLPRIPLDYPHLGPQMEGRVAGELATDHLYKGHVATAHGQTTRRDARSKAT